jgi:RNA polymerase sigma factor (sigma-70 family)
VAHDELERRFNTLLDAHGPSLMRLAGSYVRHQTEREDLFQEIVLAIWRALPRFRGECSERTFTARQRAVAALDDHERTLEDPQPTVEAQLAGEQQRERLLTAVRDLPFGYRQVVTLMLEGLSYREIAEVLGVGESNVGVRLNRARQLLKRRLER